MKPKHLENRIRQCLALASQSPCPRRQYGAVAIDPVDNVIISEGYNGGPRGGTELCGPGFCARDGARHGDLACTDEGATKGVRHVYSTQDGSTIESYKDSDSYHLTNNDLITEVAKRFPSIPSGEKHEVGCHHAEFNVVMNAARLGRALKGAWLICTGIRA